jgi:hypothetical protein
MDNSRLKSSYTCAVINGLSGHDVQFLTVNNIYAATNRIPLKLRTRLINNDTLTNFQTLINQETWGSVYGNKDPNFMFNSFLSTFLNIFEAGFPVTCKSTNKKKNDRITQGIKILCTHKEVCTPSLRTAMIQSNGTN